MTRTVSIEQLLFLEQEVTHPVFLIEIEVVEPEYLSTNGAVTIDGTPYVESAVSLENIDDWRQAVVRLPGTLERRQQLNSQSWRDGFCRIHLLPALYFAQLVDPGYVDDGYALEGLQYSEPILLVDGTITSGDMSDEVVSYTIENRVSASRWLPGIRISAPVFNHLPKAGQVFIWENDRFTLEAR